MRSQDRPFESSMTFLELESFLRVILDVKYFIKGSLVANFRYTNFWVAGQE